jgi:intracellular septation protein A
MIAFLGKLFTSFLSSIIFFAVFAIAGDVLIAAVVATACAAAQLALAAAARGKPGGTWASLAIVLVLTGTTLAGIDVTDSALASRQIVTPVNDTCPVPHSTI